jgi:hypothetical protein
MERFGSIRDLSLEVYLGMLAVASVLLAIPLARFDLDKAVRLPQLVFSGLAVVGFVLAGTGLLGVAAFLLTRMFAKDATWSEFRPVSRGDAKAVRHMMSEAFGDESPTPTRILEWQRRNGGVMTAVYTKKLVAGKASRELVGVFKIVPLKREAIGLIEREEVTGANFPPELIADPAETPAGLYIGDVLAVTARAKGDLLRQLIGALKRRSTPSTPLYTRPLTSHGSRLVRKYGFKPVASDLPAGALGRIHKLENASGIA